jgi:hypothetical protein
MSTSANLPAGAFITTINGQRCTAVPRSLTTIVGSDATSTSDETAVVRTESTTAEATTSSTQAQDSTSITSDPVASSTAAAVASIPLTSSTNDLQQSQIPSSPQVIPASTSPAVVAVTTSTFVTSSQATTDLSTPQATTPPESATTSASSSTSSPHFDLGPAPTSPFNNQNGLPTGAGTTSSSSSGATIVPAMSSTSPSTSKSRVTAGPIAGGVIGGLAIVGFVAFLFWFFKRRRRYRRDSLLTPLGGERNSFNDSDRGSLAPEKFGTRFGAQLGYQTGKIRDVAGTLTAGIAGLGASLKSRVVRDRSNSPSVNLNRGNSQFLDGPIPQHSRNNSTLSDGNSQHAIKDHFNDLWAWITEHVGFSWSLRRRNKALLDPFAIAGRLTEKQASSIGGPDFSQLLRLNEDDMQLRPENQLDPRSSVPNLGSLGLNFESSDPFADPVLPLASIAQRNIGNNRNPFADPISQRQTSIPKPNTYIADIRRSRGQSTNAVKNNPTASRSSSVSRPDSRYQSGVALNRDSYRDTVFSSLSVNARKGKGRSDPFDLERPELLLRTNQKSNTNANQDHKRTSSRPTIRSSSTVFPDPLRMSSVQANTIGRTGNHARKVSVQHSRSISNDFGTILYSSSVSSLASWAGPGPDLGPGTVNSSVQGDASSDGGSLFRSNSGKGVYAEGTEGTGIIKGSLTEMDLAVDIQREVHNVSPLSMDMDWDSRWETHNASPVSVVSKYGNKGGVGRAI